MDRRLKKPLNSMRHVEIDLISIAGLSTPLTRSQDKNFEIITRLWQKFNREIHKIKNRQQSPGGWEKFGLTYKVDLSYHYLAGILFTQEMRLPTGMDIRSISQGTYILFNHHGRLKELKSTLNCIYREILPEHKIKPDVKTGLIYFERYDSRFKWNHEGSLIEVNIPFNLF